MTLEALGLQYTEEADNLSGLITSCCERRKAAMRRKNGSEAVRLGKLAELHAQQQKDLIDISIWLNNYYDPFSGESFWSAPPLATGGWVRIA